MATAMATTLTVSPWRMLTVGMMTVDPESLVGHIWFSWPVVTSVTK